MAECLNTYQGNLELKCKKPKGGIQNGVMYLLPRTFLNPNGLTADSSTYFTLTNTMDKVAYKAEFNRNSFVGTSTMQVDDATGIPEYTQSISGWMIVNSEIDANQLNSMQDLCVVFQTKEQFMSDADVWSVYGLESGLYLSAAEESTENGTVSFTLSTQENEEETLLKSFLSAKFVDESTVPTEISDTKGDTAKYLEAILAE